MTLQLEISLKWLKNKQTSYSITRETKSIYAILQKDHKGTAVKPNRMPPVAKKNKPINDSTTGFEQSQDVGGIFQELTMSEIIVPTVFQGCCKGFIRLYTDYCESLDARLFAWKEDVGVSMKTIVESVRVILKEREGVIDKEYNKRLGMPLISFFDRTDEIDEKESAKVKLLQTITAKIQVSYGVCTQDIGDIYDVMKTVQKLEYERYNLQIQSCTSTYHIKDIKEALLQEYQDLEAGMNKDQEKAFQPLDALNKEFVGLFGEALFLNLLDLTKIKKKCSEKLKTSLVEVEALKLQFEGDCDRRLMYLTFMASTDKLMHEFKVMVESEHLKFVTFEKELNSSIQVLSANRKSLPTEIADIEPFILNSYSMLKKYNGYLAHLGLADNAAQVKDLTVQEWSITNQPSVKPIDPKKDKKLADSGTSKPVEAAKEVAPVFFTLEEVEEQLYKKSRDRVVELSSDFYKQKFGGKGMLGIPANNSEFMSATEARFKAIRAAYNEKRQHMIQSISFKCGMMLDTPNTYALIVQEMTLFNELCQTASISISSKLENKWRQMISEYIKETSNWNLNKRILQRNLQISDQLDHLSGQEFNEKLSSFDRELETMYAVLKEGVMQYFEDVTKDEVVKFDYILDGVCRIGHLILNKVDKRSATEKAKVYEFKALQSATFPLVRSSSHGRLEFLLEGMKTTRSDQFERLQREMEKRLELMTWTYGKEMMLQQKWGLKIEALHQLKTL